METQLIGSVHEKPSTPAITAAPPVPPPSSRRPRVREVSSRFMSPVSSYSSSCSSSAGDLHLTSNSPVARHPHHHQRSISAQRQRRQLRLPEGDENRQAETTRSLDSPFPFNSHHGIKSSRHHSHKPLKENSHRLDTPTPMAMPSSRQRVSHQRSHSASAAAKLLQSNGMSLSAQASGVKTSETWDVASSVSSDSLPTISSRSNFRISSNVAASPLSRSLSSPMQSCEDVSNFRTIKNGNLPPVPPAVKTNADTRKSRKAQGHQEDIHCFKLLYNRYMQWRYVNAKTETRAGAQKKQAERMLYSHGLKISELYDSVQRQRIELRRSLSLKALFAITESQIPSLEEWSSLQGDYLMSLSEATQALLNASMRIPVDGGIRVDAKELGEALGSATKILETITLNIRTCVPKAEELELLISELAKVTSGERVLIQECGGLLAETHAAQVEESSLRGQLIQQHGTTREN